jgi:hypothetical protein
VSRSKAADQQIAETAERERGPTALAAEAGDLMRDPNYVREAEDVVRLMGEMRAPS